MVSVGDRTRPLEQILEVNRYMMENNDIEVGVRKVFVDILALPADVTLLPHDGMEQVPGWDSLNHANLVFEMESRFGVSFDMDELLAMNSVGAFVHTIENKLLSKVS